MEYAEQMGTDELEAFLEGEYFGDETTRELNKVDEYFEEARRDAELNVVLGQWLLAQEPRVALEPWEISGWVQYRVSSVRNRRQFRRAAERAKTEPVYVPFCRSMLREAVGREVTMIIGTEKVKFRGEPQWAWHVLADDGKSYYLVELDSGELAVLDEGRQELSVGAVTVPAELRHRDLLR